LVIVLKRRKEMNKKTKKLLVSLLSVLMVLSFMPTMAFAADDTTHTHDAGDFSYDADASTAPECTGFGIDVWTCEGEYVKNSEGDYELLECNAQVKDLVIADAASHDYVQVRLDKLDVLQVLIDTGRVTTINQILTFLTDHASDCYAFVNQCTKCEKYDLSTLDWKDHVKPADTPACAASFTCEVCKAEVANTGAAAHTWKYEGTTDAEVQANWEYIGLECADGETNGVKVYQNECTKCGKKTQKQIVVGTPVHATVEPKYNSEAEFNSTYPNATERTQALRYLIRTGTNSTNYKYYEPNAYDDDVTGPTCSAESAENYGLLVCPECGMQLTNNKCRAPKLDHTPATYTTSASCETDGFEVTACAVCGTKLGEKKVADKTGHSYKMTIMEAPTIYDDGITVIQCEKCGKFTTNRQSDVTADYKWATRPTANATDTVVNSKADDSGDWYFIGFNREFYDDSDASKPIITDKAIKLTDWHALTPHWGAYEDYAEATCTMPALQAEKDSVSGDFWVHNVKKMGKALGHEKMVSTVKATCGTYGYSYNSCTRCKNLLDVDGETAYGGLEELLIDYDYDYVYLADSGYLFDLVKPIVAEGAECTFEWKVTKTPTATEDGEKALVCTKCNAVKPGSETVVPRDTDEAKDLAIEAATPAIEAAADIIANKAKYTTASMKAIDEARAMLNQAIAAGSAADVTRCAQILQKAVDEAAQKKANPIKAKNKTVKAKAAKKTTFSAKKAFGVSKAQGKVTYKKATGNKKNTVSKAGKVTVKKGLKKGKSYKVKVKITAAGNGNYLKKTIVKTLTVKVK
jgi:hypothetical protein